VVQQVAAKFSESLDSINSMGEEKRSASGATPIKSPNQNQVSDPTVSDNVSTVSWPALDEQLLLIRCKTPRGVQQQIKCKPSSALFLTE